MQKIEVKNFGPIVNCEFEINKFMVLIGPQASGKSTLSKLIYFFMYLRDLTISFIRTNIEYSKQFPFREFTQTQYEIFQEFFGSIINEGEYEIFYRYDNDLYIQIQKPSIGQPMFSFSPKMQTEIHNMYDKLNNLRVGLTKPSIFSTPEGDLKNSEYHKTLRDECERIFNTKKELLFIPAGRISLFFYPELMGTENTDKLDFTARRFINRILIGRTGFNKRLEFILSEAMTTRGSSDNEDNVLQVIKSIRKILKGDYLCSGKQEILSINENINLKTIFVSSGQQAVLWPLLSLFSVALEETDAMIFIEEPEAHLFPETQKDLIELISFIHKNYNGDFFITTHSPYILTSINNLIYADAVGKMNEAKVEGIVPKDIWLSSEDVGGFYLNNGKTEDLFAHDLKMFKTELIDSASETIEDTYSKLSDIEFEEKQ